MYAAETLVTADYANIIVGDCLPDHYQPSDAVHLAEATTADILTVGDSREILPAGDTTDCCLGTFDDNLDAVHAADAFLIVGVNLKTAKKMPWSVFSGDGIVMTYRSSNVYQQAVEEIPFSYWIGNADATKLQEVATKASELATPPDPATVYSERTADPDPPVELLSNNDTPAEVKQCEVCHTLTNHKIAIGGGFPGPAIEWQCPAVVHRNHDRLEVLLKQREQLERRRQLYDEATEVSQRALERVENEYQRLTERIEKLREWFDGRFDDVVSPEPDLSDVDQFEPRELPYKST